jgi:multidrug efflux pump subunit AcrA (membrane-fusion protein)
MKRLIIPILLILTLTACSGGAPTPLPTVVLDTAPASDAPAGAITASAVVVPLQEARLSFPSIGRVQSVDVKVGDQVQAGQALVHIDTSLLEARVREAEANVAAAEIQVKYLKRVGTDERFLESAEADVERAQALLDSAKAMLESQAALAAPFDGTVVTVDVAPGETVVPGRAVILLGDLSKYQIETTDLSERDVTRVKVGQPVRVFIEALNQDFTGKVVKIDLISSTLGGDVVFTVTVELDKQPQGLLWGMSADVEIQTE